mgnify:CR=1 FL=1
MQTLPDYLRHGLMFVSIGHNPSPVSVKAGYYFANPRNRFWPALNASRLVDAKMEPGAAAMEELFRRYDIGFTDLAKKATAMGRELRAADYREGARVLGARLREFQPGIAWFHGKVTYRKYLQYAEDMDPDADIPWGAQKFHIGKTRIFVTPNPSPANAAYSLEDLVRHYNAMVSYRIREQFGLG